MSLVLIESKPAANPRKKLWYRSPKIVRHAVMLFFFLFLLRVAYHHQIYGGGPNGTPSVEAYCPFGGIETMYHLVTSGGFIRRIEPSAIIILAAVLILTLLFSRGFCGWICPFGSLQEWIGMLGRKLFGKTFNPSGRVDRALRYVKYVLLVAIVGLTWHVGALVFRDYDPFLAFFHLGKGIDEMPWAYAALSLVLIGSLKIERFFCKYACPLGAVIGIVGKLGLMKVRRDVQDCKSCNLCQKKCFAHVEFLNTTSVRDAECNHCLDCVVDCPRPNVLSLRGANLRLSHGAYAAALIAGLFLVVGSSQLYGVWRTKPAFVALSTNGKLDADQIRGWMTLADISSGYGVPLNRLRSAAGLPDHAAPNVRLNQLAGTYNLNGFEPDAVREAVRSFISNQPAAKPKPSAGEQDLKGFMTLNEIVMKTGVPKEHILKGLGVKGQVDARKPVRDWIHDQGKTMTDLRELVQRYRTGGR